jgi:hypothetical protein
LKEPLFPVEGIFKKIDRTFGPVMDLVLHISRLPVPGS